MDYEMTLNDNSIARNLSIDNMTGFKCIRNTFQKHMSNRSLISDKFEPIIYRSLSDDRSLYNLCVMSIDNGFRILVADKLELPFVFKHKASEVKPLYRYVPNHVRSSVIKTVLLDGSGSTRQRVERAVYLFYYYWFFNLREHTTINIVSHNVCIDLETVISTIINKSLGLYKNYTITGEIVEILRDKLMSERLGNLDI